MSFGAHHNEPENDPVLLRLELDAAREEIERLRADLHVAGMVVAAVDLTTENGAGYVTYEEVWLLQRVADRTISDALRERCGWPVVDDETLAKFVARALDGGS